MSTNPAPLLIAGGEWRDYRNDDMRAGVQIFPAALASLKPLWSLRLGGGYQEIEPVNDGTGDLLFADAGGIQRVSAEGEFRWRTKPFGAHWITGVRDLDADGRLEIVTSNGRELIILSAKDGAFLFRSSIGPPMSYGTYATMFQMHSFFGNGVQIIIPCFSHKEVLMYDCSKGAEHTRIMHRLWMDDGFHPSTVIGDVNKDGVDEIVIARLGGIYVFSPESGEMISQTLWNSDSERRRNYGHFELSDIDGDGDLEAVILSDKVSRHIAVLDNDGRGYFTPLWDRLIEHIYPTDTTELRYTTNSLSDLDGDGRPEIAVSIFNDRKDGRWHTEVLRATTGELVTELPDHYLRGIQDVNGVGIRGLCLSKETARKPADRSELSIYSCKENKVLWSLESGSFAERSVHLAPHYSEFKPDVFASQELWSGCFGGKEGIFLRSNGGLCLLTKDLKVESIDFVSGHPFRIAHIDDEAIYITKANGDVVRVRDSGSEHFLSCGYHLTTEAHISARPGITPVVFCSDSERYIAVPNFSNGVNIYRGNQGASPTLVKKLQGRSRLGYDGVFHAVSVIETYDGPRLVIIDDAGLDHARLSLYSPSGEQTHHYDFPDLPHSAPGNRMGCYDWLYFQHSRGEALFASFYQSPSMNSECSLAFLLENGEIVWRINHTGSGEYGRGVGPWGSSTLRIEDGKPIAIFCAKDTLCQLDLETGTFLHEPNLLTDYTAEAMKAAALYVEQDLSKKSSVDDPFTAYGTPVLVGNDIVIAGCFGGFGVLSNSSFISHLSSFPRWWHVASFGDVLYRMPGIGDLDGDGKLELGQGHADGTFRIYDYGTGFLRQSIELNAIATDTLTLDFNSDGRMEFVIGTSDGQLLTIGLDGEKFGILAEYYAGAAMGSPVAADLDGDGTSEVFVVSADGSLLCFG
jgi:hypothetical protein